MSHLVSRILLASIIVPVALVADMIMMTAADKFMADPWELWSANMATAAFMMAAWTLLWRGSVRWNLRRIGLSSAALAAAAMGGAVIGWIIAQETIDAVGIIFGVLSTPLLWMFMTVLIWRETATERGARYADANAQ